MTLKLPDYIPIERIKIYPVDYKWDDWDPYVPIGEPDAETEKELSQLSNLAIIAYSIGCAEWTVYRLSEYIDDSIPYDFIEACWAWIMNTHIMYPPQSDPEEWEGPIRGAIDLSLMTILNTIYWAYETVPETGVQQAVDSNEEDEDEDEDQDEDFELPSVQAAFNERITLHVLKDKELFLDWRVQVLQRLKKLYPRSEDDLWGVSIPREVFDLSVMPDTGLYQTFIHDFNDNLDFQKNNCLNRLENGRTTR